MKIFLTVLVLLAGFLARAQTLGGNSVYNFLKLSPSPQLTALGGVNGSALTEDMAMAYHNPALLRPSMHGYVSANFNLFYAGIKSVHSQAALYKQNWKTAFTLGVHYLNYGTTDQTDASGNVMGVFRPHDYVVQLSASRQYLEKWFYGATLKFIQSSYGQYQSSGIALDFGLNYRDSASRFQASFLARNMGTQLSTYGGQGEDMPFDLQLSITKRLNKAPFQFSLTAQRLHQFDLVYNDTTFNNAEGVSGPNDNFLTNLFRHFVLATQCFIGERLEFTVGYNVLQRAELSVNNSTNGLTGVSFGAGANLKNMQIRYARTQYQSGTGFNQFGINIRVISP